MAPSGDPFFLSTANTFRRMRANEFALAQPYRLHVVQATDGTTIGGARQGKPHQEVSAAAAAALQQPLPGRRAEARRPRQDGPVEGTKGTVTFSSQGEDDRIHGPK